MQHHIPVKELIEPVGPQIAKMAEAIEACVHCGFCLPVCPTYQVLGQEMDSPRGRIMLMKSALEGELSYESVTPYVDRCLGCLACVTACPSGVHYGELLTPFRAYTRQKVDASWDQKIQRKLVSETLPYPQRFKTAAALGGMVRPMRNALPLMLRNMLDLLPDRLPKAQPLPAVFPAQGPLRARVAFLTGCVQQVISPQINWATLRVLSRNGVEVIIPQEQVCCGALHMHAGDFEAARQLAGKNISLFPKDVDAILTNAAGCGSGMKEYDLLFEGTDLAEQAHRFSNLVQDISVFLNQLGLIGSPSLPYPMQVAYHDACHLAHAQGISAPPRQLLTCIENLELVEIPEGGTCCGSAGTYNIEQPEIAAQLGEMKIEHIMESQAQAVAAGNIGCMVQISNHLKQGGAPIPVFHTLELLDLAYGEA